MQRYAPVQLGHYSREVEAVAWSQDQRIAVTSSDAVYILTLQGLPGSSPSSLPASMSIISSPPCPRNPTQDSPKSYDPSCDGFNFSLYFDPTLIPGHAPTAYRESGWSPAGCDIVGGCLLSVLTVGGRLWLLTPPGSQTMKWKISTCLSSLNPDSGNGGCTAFHWLPYVIPAENGVGGAAIVAVATRSRIRVLALEVPVRRDRDPVPGVVWEGEVETGGKEDWPCRLCWSHTPSPNGFCHLAVGMTSGQLVSLSLCLPSHWRVGGASENALSDERRRVVMWSEPDGMAVRHIAWEHSTHSLATEQPWLVFSKVSRLVAMQLPKTTPTGTPPYTTVYGVHSRAVSGLSSLPGGQYISSSLDSSVQVFSLDQSSCDSHVTPTSVAVGTTCEESTAQGVACSDHALYSAVLTSSSASSRQKQCSQLNICPLLPLSHLDMHKVRLSWDVSEAIRTHVMSKKTLPGNMTSQHSPLVEACVEFHTRQLEGGEGGEGGDGSGDTGDTGAVVLMEHVCRVLGGWEGVGEDGENATMSLYVMGRWVESSTLATPTQQALAKQVLSRLQYRAEVCSICHFGKLAIPFTHHRRATCANGHIWERCCVTLLVATSSLCGRCRGCGAVSHNMMSLKTTTNGSWFEQLLSNGQCTYCQGFFDIIT